MTENMLDYLKKLARVGVVALEDPAFNVYEESGGNYDDAYYLGVSDGEVALAIKILEDISK